MADPTQSCIAFAAADWEEAEPAPLPPPALQLAVQLHVVEEKVLKVPLRAWTERTDVLSVPDGGESRSSIVNGVGSAESAAVIAPSSCTRVTVRDSGSDNPRERGAVGAHLQSQ